jgi:uncharacterized coiled-coil protein SlyX
MVLNLVAIVFLFTCGIVFGNGLSTIGENELFYFKQKMVAMEEKMAKQEFRISSLEDQLKIRYVEIKDLKEKVMKLGPKVQEVEKSVTSLKVIIMRITPVEPENKPIGKMKRRRNHFILEQKEIVSVFKEVLIANFDVLKYIYINVINVYI